MNLYSPVTVLKGVGDAKAKILYKIGIETVMDLVRHYPRAYQNKGDVKRLSDAAFIAKTEPSPPPVSLILTVSTEPKVSEIRRGLTLMKFVAFDESGALEVVYFNQPYLKDTFHIGDTFRFWGRVSISMNRSQLINPVSEKIEDDIPLPPIIPVYPLSRGLTQKYISNLVKEALKLCLPLLSDHIPPDILQKNNLCTLSYALKNIHYPKDTDALAKARRRLAFDEVFTLTVAMCSIKRKSSREAYPCRSVDISDFLAALPYELTEAQKRSVGEIAADMEKSECMNRILCGDVGSGKTAVAEAAAYIAVKSGTRCAVMAPTEILAKQHYAEFSRLFRKFDIPVGLLCGSMKDSDKKRVRDSLKSPTGVKIVIGTHALLSDVVEFENFGLVITDEQHRFGAVQRSTLWEKAKNAHSLAMSATPIPRTLSLVVYGDIDISRLDEMPAGRQKVGTFHVNEGYRQRLLGFIAKQAKEGHRTYIVCPAIEESEIREEAPEEMCDIFFEKEEKEPPVKAALTYTAELKSCLPSLSIDCIHGKMKAGEKDAVMASFISGDTQVLVSTTVIEVGVNVPEATLIVVENAERFGLSQLHQLRGRVGRGRDKSYCILVSDTKSEKSLKRLETMCRTNDGFAIAEEDLKTRGPGDFFKQDGNIRQSGKEILRFSSFLTDTELIASASRFAKIIVDTDPTLTMPEHRALLSTVLELRKSII